MLLPFGFRQQCRGKFRRRGGGLWGDLPRSRRCSTRLASDPGFERAGREESFRLQYPHEPPMSRRFQFSLAGLFLLTMAVGVLLARFAGTPEFITIAMSVLVFVLALLARSSLAR